MFGEFDFKIYLLNKWQFLMQTIAIKKTLTIFLNPELKFTIPSVNWPAVSLLAAQIEHVSGIYCSAENTY